MPGIDVSKSLGPLLIAELLSSIIFGITVLQAFLYFTKHANKDQWPLKLLVAAAGLFDTFHVFLGYHALYYYTITSFADPVRLAKTIWSYQIATLFGAPHIWLVQMFFAHRIYVLSGGKMLIPAFVSLLATLLAADDIVWSARALGQSTLKGQVNQTHVVGLVGYGLGLGVNLVITASVSYYLYQKKSEAASAGAGTTKLMDSIVDYMLKTSLLITICAIISMILAVKTDGTNYVAIFYEMGVRLYLNSLLSTLNNRSEHGSSGMSDGTNSNRLRFGESNGVSLSRITDQKSSARSEPIFAPEKSDVSANYTSTTSGGEV